MTTPPLEPARLRKPPAERRAQIVQAATQIAATDGYRNVGNRKRPAPTIAPPPGRAPLAAERVPGGRVGPVP
jgi:hypothetical protein